MSYFKQTTDSMTPLQRLIGGAFLGLMVVALLVWAVAGDFRPFKFVATTLADRSVSLGSSVANSEENKTQKARGEAAANMVFQEKLDNLVGYAEKRDAVIYQYFRTPNFVPVGQVKDYSRKLENGLSELDGNDANGAKEMLGVLREIDHRYQRVFAQTIQPSLQKRREKTKALLHDIAPDAKKLVSNILMLAQKHRQESEVEITVNLLSHLLTAQIDFYSYVLSHSPRDQAKTELEFMAMNTAYVSLEYGNLRPRQAELLEQLGNLIVQMELEFKGVVAINKTVHAVVTRELASHSEEFKITVARFRSNFPRKREEVAGHE